MANTFLPAISFAEFAQLGTEELRDCFLTESLFVPGLLILNAWETDRAIIGGAMPTEETLELSAEKQMAARYFCERREMGIINLGGPGKVIVDETTFGLKPLDGLYIGRGSQSVSFTSDSSSAAKFFLISYPAHYAYPTTLIPQESARKLAMGDSSSANVRTIYQYIHPEGVKSCQLVMGFTELSPGSVWNTMPPHTHLRRSEVYHYFNLTDEAAVAHFMGTSDETRHLWLKNHDTVLSPAWSIHSGCGTQSYSFIWAMGGENQDFQDMDRIFISELR